MKFRLNYAHAALLRSIAVISILLLLARVHICVANCLQKISVFTKLLSALDL